MSILSINIDKIYGTVSAADVAALKGEMEQGNRMLQDGSGKGSDFLAKVCRKKLVQQSLSKK